MPQLPEPFRSQRQAWKRRLWSMATFWLAFYVALAAAPLVLLLIGRRPAGRTFLIELGAAFGVVAFTTLALQFLSTARFRHIAPLYGTDAQLLFHRVLGIFAFCIAFAHPAVLLVAEPKYLEYFDPRVNTLRTLFLVAAMLALVALLVLSLFRKRLGVSYEWWRLTHGGLALAVILVAIAHALQVHHYVRGIPKQALWLVIGATPFALLGYVRLVKPWRQRQRPWRLVEVREERGKCWTLVLEPEGHDGMPFRGGQYVWITVNDSPFALQQHPFSLSSSAEHPERVEITSKELGDFTSMLKHLTLGTRCFLEGPYGAFTLEGQVADGAVFIMGGIGVTPAMSILRTCRDRDDQRPVVLIYANNKWDDVAFREELDVLKEEINLRLVHVLSQPHEGWTGESGYVTPEVLDRHLPRDPTRSYHFYVCGPPKMMELVEKGLADRGVHLLSRSVEQFDIV